MEHESRTRKTTDELEKLRDIIGELTTSNTMVKSELVVSKQTILDLQNELKRQQEEGEVLKKGIHVAEHQLAQVIADAEIKDKKTLEDHALLKVMVHEYPHHIYVPCSVSSNVSQNVSSNVPLTYPTSY